MLPVSGTLGLLVTLTGQRPGHRLILHVRPYPGEYPLVRIVVPFQQGQETKRGGLCDTMPRMSLRIAMCLECQEDLPRK
jgi:hypothetical protein